MIEEELNLPPLDWGSNGALLPVEAEGGDATGPEKRPNVSEKLASYAMEGAELFRTPPPSCEPFIRTAEGRLYRVDSEAFADRLIVKYREKHAGAVPTRAQISNAVRIIEAEAREHGAEQAVFPRIGRVGNTLFVGVEGGRTVEIDRHGWRFMDEPPPVLIYMDAARRPLPEPVRGRKLDADLRREFFANVGDDAYRLIVGWLLAALFRRGTLPILCLQGQQGAGKSMTATLLQNIVDPLVALDADKKTGISEPNGAEDLWVAASWGPVLNVDNLSNLTPEMQDALCQIAQGGTFKRRKLYSNGEPYTVEAHASCVLTSITEVVDRGDLLQRAFVIDLQPRTEYEAEEDIFRRFRAFHGLILGALFDAVAAGLARYDETPKGDSRLSDAARFVTACEGALGWPAGAFARALGGNAEAKDAIALEASIVGEYVEGFIRSQPLERWEGSPTMLYAKLTAFAAGPMGRAPQLWPKGPRGLSQQLTRLAGALRGRGIVYEKSHSRERTVALFIEGEAKPGADDV